MLKFDANKLISLLSDFHRLTGIKICIYDEDGTEVASVPEHICTFCEYVRSSDAGLAACKKSDCDAFSQCRKSGTTYTYRCHMGLTECVSPILQHNRIIGFIMLGQTADKSAGDFENIRRTLRAYNLDEKKAAALYAGIEFSSEEKVKSAVAIMNAIAGYLYLNKLIDSTENTAAKIAAYVNARLDGNLDVDTLCRVFALSRVDLYDYFRHAFGCTPARYVRKARLTRACELLESGKTTVTKIAQAVGVCDYNYFSKIFKAEYGISPREYRRKFATR